MRRTCARFRKLRSCWLNGGALGVNIDYHVEYDDNYYSVPHALVRQEVELPVS